MLCECSGQISLESANSTYPINSFKETVLSQKTIASFRHLKICKHVKPGPNEDESWWEFRLSLSFGMQLSCTLIDSRALFTTLNVLKFFMRVYESLTKSRSRLARVGDSRWELTKTLMWVNSHQLSSSFGRGLTLLCQQDMLPTNEIMAPLPFNRGKRSSREFKGNNSVTVTFILLVEVQRAREMEKPRKICGEENRKWSSNGVARFVRRISRPHIDQHSAFLFFLGLGFDFHFSLCKEFFYIFASFFHDLNEVNNEKRRAMNRRTISRTGGKENRMLTKNEVLVKSSGMRLFRAKTSPGSQRAMRIMTPYCVINFYFKNLFFEGIV